MRALLIPFFFLFGTAYAAPIEINQQFDRGSLILKLDDSRIDIAALKRYLVVHPILYDSEFYIGEQLALCIADDPTYKPCGTRDIHAKYFLENAIHNLQLSKQRLAYLNSLHEFPKLQPLVDYFRSSLQFKIWVDERLLEYFQTWNPAALEQNFKGLPLASKTKDVLDKLKNASDIESRWELSYGGWHNIAIHLYRGREGAMPSDVWKKFLRKNQIVESIVEVEGED